jgi:Uma2 family endonuclease
MEAVQTLSEYELERGKPMPSKNHAIAQINLLAALLRFKDEYSILPELSLELDGQPFTPDVTVYPRLETDWQHDEVRMTEPPLLTVEILSPKQTMDELMRKAEAYLTAGVKACWILQPMIETLSVLQPGRKPQTYTSGEVTDPATGITVTLEEIFV